MSASEDSIAEILEVHYCDLLETSDFENELRKNVVKYFDGLDLTKRAIYHKALSDEKRLGILKLLEFREMCVCELTAALGVTQPNLSHHIKKLESAGLVNSERRGKWVYYSLVRKIA
jgi:DNA-binding MarR family transcriptional regulator